MSESEMLKLIAELQAQVKSSERKLTLKVSEKGAVCLYGMGRFPVTLYMSQWQKVLAHAKEIEAFIEAFIVANKDKLAQKASA